MFILESAGSISDPLPVVFETTEDSTINNLTRNDINCDKTGTCYDGIYKNRLINYDDVYNYVFFQ